MRTAYEKIRVSPVFCGYRISQDDNAATESLASHIIRASFSQERMRYLDQEGNVVYTVKDKKTSKVFLRTGMDRHDLEHGRAYCK